MAKTGFFIRVTRYLKILTPLLLLYEINFGEKFVNGNEWIRLGSIVVI